jgi:hypothetical protein
MIYVQVNLFSISDLPAGVNLSGAANVAIGFRFLEGHALSCPIILGPDGAAPPFKTQIISTGHFGSALKNERPYGFVTIRLSRTTMTPRSVFVRIKRPTP